ncbi:MAG: enoyl-CoA hydratase/isomerase family protein [Desulfobacteraceae bacterium]|nr:MAG: enoyl-CoA hydratase/isomerase family protein [Desulfobacteraceae bacterium]
MVDYKTIILEERDGLAVLTLNNPENRNPLTEETKSELISALTHVAQTDELRALVITAKGTAFCAGGDVKNVGKELTPDDIRAIMQKSQELLLRLVNLEKPGVAAVNGDAFGMGCNLVLATDFAIASEKSRFCEVFAKIGIVPDFGALYFLPRLIGLWKSKELIYLGDVISADEALKMGLVYQVVSHEQLEKTAMALASRLARMPTLAIGRAKRVLNKAFDMTLAEVLEEEISAQIYLSQTQDYREGMQALLEKRRPKFQGR